ncbi:MAG: GNAT family N-acetyltransferase [Sphingobacteriales bacterium]|nr:GNAT family N-acetyltransferase [Sphingobacteriales bacterium]MBI3720175.1 GNAT family N-acetyltransferase [Sphingobacteriales bacterium]
MQREGYSITTDTTFFNLEYIHHFLTHSYWAEGIPIETVQRSIDNSLCFGVFHLGRQIGFARMITDKATFAYLADVFIDEAYRGKGLSKWLVEEILSHPELQGLRRMMLATRDAHGLYAQYGFVPLTFVDRWMNVHRPDIYKKEA